MYKDHARAFLGRVNTVHGRTYSQDDTILGETCGSAAPLTAASHGWAVVEVTNFMVIHTMLFYAFMYTMSGERRSRLG